MRCFFSVAYRSLSASRQLYRLHQHPSATAAEWRGVSSLTRATPKRPESLRSVLQRTQKPMVTKEDVTNELSELLKAANWETDSEKPPQPGHQFSRAR